MINCSFLLFKTHRISVEYILIIVIRLYIHYYIFSYIVINRNTVNISFNQAPISIQIVLGSWKVNSCQCPASFKNDNSMSLTINVVSIFNWWKHFRRIWFGSKNIVTGMLSISIPSFIVIVRNLKILCIKSKLNLKCMIYIEKCHCSLTKTKLFNTIFLFQLTNTHYFSTTSTLNSIKLYIGVTWFIKVKVEENLTIICVSKVSTNNISHNETVRLADNVELFWRDFQSDGIGSFASGIIETDQHFLSFT